MWCVAYARPDPRPTPALPRLPCPAPQEKANAEGGGWLAGGKLSFADVVVFTYLSGITSPIMEGGWGHCGNGAGAGRGS